MWKTVMAIAAIFGSVNMVAAERLDPSDPNFDPDDYKVWCRDNGMSGPWQPTKWVPLRPYSKIVQHFKKEDYRFEWETALWLYRLSFPTYYGACNNVHKLEPIENAENRGGIFGYSTFLDKHSWYGDVLELDNSIVLFLRGTMDIPGWIVNMQTSAEAAVADFPGKIHQGFWKTYTGDQGSDPETKLPWGTMREQVTKVISSLPYTTKDIYISGHSLGAAMATLVAYGLKKDLPDANVLLMTFGSPRVGNVDFAAEFDRLIPNTWRVNNLLDPVPKIPLMIMGYEHVGIKEQFYLNACSRGKDVPMIDHHLFSYEDWALFNLGLPFGHELMPELCSK